MKKGMVINGTIGADTHVIGARMMQFALEQEGFDVVCLGAYVTQEEFVNAAIETNGDAIFVSSIYGLAELDCTGLREKCIESGVGNILLYVGGNITTEYNESNWHLVEEKFKQLGFNRVYPPGTMPSTAIRDLEKDLGIKGNC